jgi:hypothetical protein
MNEEMNLMMIKINHRLEYLNQQSDDELYGLLMILIHGYQMFRDFDFHIV